MSKNCRILILIISCLMSSLFVSAQMNERRVFLWDVSESLNKLGLYKPLQNSLITSIESIPVNPANDIILIPFYDCVLDQIKVKATEDGKSQLISYIKSKDKAIPHGTCRTNIVEAIRVYLNNVDPQKRNYMFLYTDGENEIGNLGAELSQWNAKTSGKNCYGFYVLVHPYADKPEVRVAEKTQSNFWVVPNATVRIKTLDLRPNISFNSRNETIVNVPISGDLSEIEGKLCVECQDPIYDVVIQNQNIVNGILALKIMAKNGATAPAGDFTCRFFLDKKDPFTFVTPNQVGVKVLYKPERVLNVTIK